jgi:pyruvate dehydrogenase E2 component (dihydrolipoamide acetyltransferase)
MNPSMKGQFSTLGAKEGQAVKVNDVLAVVGKKGEDYQALLQSAGQSARSWRQQSSAEPKAEVVAAPATTQAIDTAGIKAEIVLMPKMSDTMT